MDQTFMQRYSRADPYDESPSPIDSSAVRSGYSGVGNDAMTNAIANFDTSHDWSNKGVPDSIEKQVFPARALGHPLENFLGGVQDQESYRPAMMQYLAAGGKKPQWMTGNFEVDRPNIEAAISATMTPEQQMKRQEIQIRQSDLEDQRSARNAMAKDKEAAREREVAAKREALQAKVASANRQDTLTAHNVLGGVLGEAYIKTPLETVNAISARIASRAKAKLGTEEGQGADLETLMQQEVDNMVMKGELKLPQQASGLRGFMGYGQPEQATEFNSRGAEPAAAQPAAAQPAAPTAAPTAASAQDWIARAQAHPKNKGISLATIIANGKRLGKIP